ncbi:MAG: cytochrome P450 [Ilumatobacteraceae bacterium]
MAQYQPVVENLDPPWEAIAADRRECPVAHVSLPEQEYFQITRYDLVTEVLRNHKVFSNIHGTTVAPESISEEEQVLAFADPPRHTKQRRLLVSAFSPARVDAIGPHIQQVADDYVDLLPPDGGTFELTTALGAALPVQIICEMLGVPLDDRDDFRRWSEISERAASVADRSAFAADLEAFSAYLTNLVEERQRALLTTGAGPDDLITAIVKAEVDGERFTSNEVVAIIRLLLSAGNTTTTTLIGNLVKAIEEHPAEKAKLLADLEGLSMSAVDEGMRYDGPIHGLFRTALTDTEIGGVAIPQGCRVFNVYGAASHDPSVFDQPDDFVIDRDFDLLPSHLGFGMGIHHCLGSNLARMEARVAIETLYRRLPGLRIADDFVPQQYPGAIFRTYGQLQLQYDGPVGPRTSV